MDASARLRPIARSTNLELARHVIVTLRDNRLRGDDEADVIYDSDFLVKTERMMACLTDQRRQNAAASLLEARMSWAWMREVLPDPRPIDLDAERMGSESGEAGT